MSSGRALVLIAAALLAACSTAWGASTSPAASEPAKEAGKIKFPRGDWAGMVSDLKGSLSPDQLSKLKEKVDAQQAAVEAWEKRNSQRLKNIEAQLAQARQARNRGEIRELEEQRRALRTELAGIRATTRDEALAVLTEDQRSHWEAAKLMRQAQALATRGHFDFDAEQTKKVEALVKESAAKLAVLKTADKEVEKTRERFMKSLREDILTAEQRSALEAARAKARGSQTRESASRPAEDKAPS